MNKLLGMNAPPAAKVYNEKERYHVEWKDLHMSQEEQDRIAYLRERGAKHVFTPYELEVRALRSRDLEAYKKPTPLTQQFDRECKYDFKQEGLSFDPRQAPSVGGIFNFGYVYFRASRSTPTLTGPPRAGYQQSKAFVASVSTGGAAAASVVVAVNIEGGGSARKQGRRRCGASRWTSGPRGARSTTHPVRRRRRKRSGAV